MKKIYALLFLMILMISKNSTAQNNCSTPYQLNVGSNIYTLVTGTPNPDSTNDYGCLTTHSNVTWLYLQVCTAGTIDLTVMANGSSGSGADVDFVAWGPLAAPTDCPLDSTQIVDCGFGTSSTEIANIPSSPAGQYYKIMISNFSNLPGTVNVYQSGGTGQLCSGPFTGCPGSTLIPQEICQVTTDPVSNHNVIIWNKDTSYTGSYIIQEETTTAGIYTNIDTVVNSDTSAYEDMVSNTMIQSFKYRIGVYDTCGNVYYGAPHTTIHLLCSAAFSTGYPQLSWNPYVGFSYGTYFIYRGASPSTMSLYDSISASFTTYTDVVPSAGMIYYGVGVFPPTPCQPSRSMDYYSISNIATMTMTGIAENDLSDMVISPNPAKDELNFSSGKLYNSVALELYDVTGRKLLSNQYENTSKAKIDVSGIANGCYVVRLTTEKGATQKTIIISR